MESNQKKSIGNYYVEAEKKNYHEDQCIVGINTLQYEVNKVIGDF